MKGILLSVGKNRISFKKQDILYFFRRYGIDTLLGISLCVGLVFGAVCAGNADETLIKNLDFIFVSDFESRCSQTVLLSFAATLTSNFIFFVANFLLGLSVWGSVGVPFLIAFKGFGMGITGGYLYKSYGLNGVGFFLLVMLSGYVISVLALIFQGKNSILFSNSLFAKVRGMSAKTDETIYKYIINSSFMLIALSIGAMADAILNALFAGLFAFS